MALRGVNLGGWLIAEKWMTPQLFEGTDAVDEYTFMQTPDALAKLREHQRTFITRSDFMWMAGHGVEIVRIPVGYWILDGDAPYVSAIGKLDWAIRMCEQYGLKVLLDIHGLPGSQNGHDHSGQVGKPQWHKSKDTMQRGLDATLALAARYATSPALWGVQVINEPLVGWHVLKLRRYCRDVYKAVSAVLPPEVRIIYSDAFMPRFMNGAVSPGKNPVVMDIHWYHTVGWKWLSIRGWRWLTKSHARLLTMLGKSNGLIVGEWSGIYAQRLFDKHPEPEHLALVAQNIAQQMKAYETAEAWFYWSYKAGGPGVWDLKSLIDARIVLLK